MPRTRSRASGSALVLAALGLLVPLGLTAAAAPATAATAKPGANAWLRLAHLSPDTPEVDISISGPGGGAPVRLTDVGYGDVGTYLAVPAGTYSATMTLAGTGTDVLSGSATVSAGRAYTLAAVGLRESLSARVLSDDLTPPAPGNGKVRVIQASTRAATVDVQAIGGPMLAKDANFGTSTGYAEVTPGVWSVRVTPTTGDARPTVSSVEVPAGRINSLLVLDGATPDSLKVQTISDSSGASSVPKGGVDTGFGPVAHSPSARPSPGAGGVAALAALLLLGAGVTTRRRRTGRAI